jgi:tRNA A-37 threonylcarbamoyl transferase component Bud32
MVLADTAGARIQPMRVLRYEPRKHVVLASTADAGGVRRVAKILRPEAAMRARAAWAAVADYASRPASTLQCPALLHFDDRADALWLQWREGVRLDAAAATIGIEEACRLAARSIASLHRADIDLPDSPTLATLKQETLSRCETLARAYPSCADTLGLLGERIEQRLDDSISVPSVPVHGDFNPSQLLIDNGQAVMLDLDTAGRGDPLVDVAHFIAGLHRLPMSIGTADAAAEQFIECYRRSVGREIPRRRLHDLIAAVLVYRTAYKSLRRLPPDGAVGVAWCASLAMQYLNN